MTGDRAAAAPLLVVFVALIVLAMAGISSDLWRLLHARRTLAGAVDAAATAATAALDEAAYRETGVVRLDPALAEAYACDVLVASLDVGGCPGDDAAVVTGGDTVTVAAARSVELVIVGRIGLDARGGRFEIAASATAVLARGGDP